MDHSHEKSTSTPEYFERLWGALTSRCVIVTLGHPLRANGQPFRDFDGTAPSDRIVSTTSDVESAWHELGHAMVAVAAGGEQALRSLNWYPHPPGYADDWEGQAKLEQHASFAEFLLRGIKFSVKPLKGPRMFLNLGVPLYRLGDMNDVPPALREVILRVKARL